MGQSSNNKTTNCSEYKVAYKCQNDRLMLLRLKVIYIWNIIIIYLFNLVPKELQQHLGKLMTCITKLGYPLAVRARGATQRPLRGKNNT